MNAALTPTTSGLPNIGRGEIKFADFTGDGILDAIVVGQTGTYLVCAGSIKAYQGNGDGTFTDVSSTWLPATGMPTLVGAGMLAFADYDKDGDLDFCCSYFSATGAANVFTKLFNNTGSAFVDVTNLTTFSTLPAGGYFGSILWGDVDGDGDLDLIISSRVQGSGTSSLEWPSTSSNRGAAGQFFLNDGDGTFTKSTDVASNNFAGQYYADFDCDGDLDLITYGANGVGASISINNGAGVFQTSGWYNAATSPSAAVTVAGITCSTKGSNGVVGDFNNDGKPDIFSAGLNGVTTSVTEIKMYMNNMALTSASTVAEWIASSGFTASALTGPTAYGNSNLNVAMVSAADYDNDGDLDITQQGLSAGVPTTTLYTGVGTTTFTSSGETLTGLHYGGATWADVNNDGKSDLITWGYSDAATSTPVTKVYLNSTANVNTAPTAPATISATPVGLTAALSWTLNDNTDDHTPNNALTYNLRVGTSTGAGNIISPMSTSTGFRKIVARGLINTKSYTLKNLTPGTYFWSVQAIDANNVGGAWATEGSFVIDEVTETPATQAVMSATPCTGITQTQMNVSWTNGSGNKAAVFMKAATEGIAAPVNNTPYTASSVFGSGSSVGGWYCVYNSVVAPGSAGAVTVTGLAGFQAYQIMVISYNGKTDNSIINYKTTTSTNNPIGTETIDYPVPTIVTSALAVYANTTGTTVQINPSQSGTGYNAGYATVVFMKAGSNTTEDVPLETNVTYNANAVYGTGDQVGTSGWYCVFKGSSSYKGSGAFNPFTTFTGLNNYTSYQVRACTYNGTLGLEKYSATAGVTFTTPSLASTFTTAGAWETPENWSAGIPGDNTIVTISSACTRTGDVTINPAVRYTISDGASLSVSGNLVINANTVEPGTLVDMNAAGGLTVVGTTTVKQYLTGAGTTTPSDRFWYVSSPVNGATSGVFSASGNNKLWSHSEATNAYTEIIDDATALNMGQGYVARLGASATISFVGALNTGEKTIAVTRTGSTNLYRGFNLIGNPYASFLDWSLSTKTDILPTMWMRTKATSTMVFDTYNADLNVGTGNGLLGNLTKYIPPIQGFWVKKITDASTGNLVFNNSMRSHQTSNLLRSTEVDTLKQIIRLLVSNGKTRDEAILAFHKHASDSTDRFDSPKMRNNIDSLPEICLYNGKDEMVINGMRRCDSTRVMKVGFRTGKKGKFTITATELSNLEVGTKVILRDNLLNIEQDLTVEPTYEFTSEIAETADRFTLTVVKAATGINTESKVSVVAFGSGNRQIQVNLIGASNQLAKITVHTILGQEVGTFSTNSANTLLNKQFAPGIYLVKVNAEGVQVTKKVVINQ